MNIMERLGRTLAELFGHDVITYSKGSIWRKMSRLVTLITVKAKVFSLAQQSLCYYLAITSFKK